MIRIQKLGATRYYVDMERQYTQPKSYDDYLSKNNHVPAQFVGNYFDKLEYNRENYDALMAGKNPQDYMNLAAKETKNAGYDIVIAMPKSYSMLYAVADEPTRQQLNQIQQEVIKEYLHDTAKLIRPAGSRKEYFDFESDKTKSEAAVFWHIENRDLEPHLHAHINLFNFAEFTMENGEKKTFAINAQELYYRQKEMSAELNNRLCDRLYDIGIKTIGTEDGFRVVGVSDEQEKMFSGRRTEILEYIEEQKKLGNYFSSQLEAENAKQEEYVRNETKEKKPDLNSREIIEYQQKNLAEKGITLKTIMQHQKEYVYSRPEIIEPAIIRDATRLAGVVSETELRRQILDINRDLPCDQRIIFEDFCRRNELIEMDLGNGHRGYTTNEIIITEMQNIEQAKALAAGEYGKLQLQENAEQIKNETLDRLQEKYKMNEGQAAACELIAQNERIALIEGDAGTGKTTTAIKFANDYYTAQGYEVIGLATQGKTSKSLQEADIKNTQNLSQFFIKEPKGSRRVLVVDEAGMTGAEQYRQLLRYAEQNPDTKVVFVGDQKQLASVAYGTSFENIREHLGIDHQRRLWENMRQRVNDPLRTEHENALATQQQRAIAESARDREPETMLEHLKKTGGLKETDTRAEAIQKLAKDYALCEKSKIALAHTNKDVNSINDAIRRELAAQGKFDMGNQKEFTINVGNLTANRNFAQGDKIIFTGKYKKQGIEIEDRAGQPREIKTKLTIENGTEATIKKIEGDKITLTTKDDGKTYTIDAKEFNKFNHAYCLTTHKSQGVTVAESFVYANGSENANRNYVNMSRHKEAANLYIAKDNIERYIESASLDENKANLTKDVACIERYTFLKENRQELIADPYNTQNQIKDLQNQISRQGDGQSLIDLQQRLDQMHRLDSIMNELQRRQESVMEQKTVYETWKAEKAAKRGQWQNTKKPIQETEYERKIKHQEKIIEDQIKEANTIRTQLDKDVRAIQDQIPGASKLTVGELRQMIDKKIYELAKEDQSILQKSNELTNQENSLWHPYRKEAAARYYNEKMQPEIEKYKKDEATLHQRFEKHNSSLFKKMFSDTKELEAAAVAMQQRAKNINDKYEYDVDQGGKGKAWNADQYQIDQIARKIAVERDQNYNQRINELNRKRDEIEKTRKPIIEEQKELRTLSRVAMKLKREQTLDIIHKNGKIDRQNLAQELVRHIPEKELELSKNRGIQR
ncbi:MobF family relaxase [Sporomusa aerivorans]|uniref:MobF family relaxase n=1 Tax=Sporomusa aerivorans TaxID=204936 RepID=UPI00352BC38F